MIALVTGDIGCGKTTVCQRAIDLLMVQGAVPRGILSLPRLDTSGIKTGIDALDVATGERRHLANCMSGGGETIGDYTFDAETLNWAIARLQTAVAAPRSAGGTGVLVVDEIGPLELVRQDGFVTVLGPLADLNCVPRGLVVVRRKFLDVLERVIDRADVQGFWVDEASRERLPGKIADVLRLRIKWRCCQSGISPSNLNAGDHLVATFAVYSPSGNDGCFDSSRGRHCRNRHVLVIWW